MNYYQQVPAIPTEYQGVVFKSRLEARWAMFFDLIGITWEYEPGQIVIWDGTGYIPDFMIDVPSDHAWPEFVDGRFFVEIKPDCLTFRQFASLERILSGSVYRTKRPHLFLCGKPSDCEAWLIDEHGPEGMNQPVCYFQDEAERADSFRFPVEPATRAPRAARSRRG